MEELVEVFCLDKDVAKITILDSEEASGMKENLLRRSENNTVALGELDDFMPEDNLKFELLVEVLPVSLHVDKDKLYMKVLERIKALEEYAQVILVNYGLCGNSLEKLDQDIEELSTPIVMLTNPGGERVDDCICALLGGSDKYLAELKKEAGTWFMTPGWAKHWETLMLKELGLHDISKAKLLFKKASYKRVLTIANGIEKEGFLDEVHSFADLFDFYIEKKEGSLEILKRALQEAKSIVSIQ